MREKATSRYVVNDVCVMCEQEKGTMPLHVAAQSGQALQIELLLIYGADPSSYDTNGKTPVEHAT